MKILNVSCPIGSDGKPDSSQCHSNLVKSDSNIVSISHNNNNHIILYASDYDKDGHHSDDIHNLSKSLMSGDLVKAKTIATKLSVSIK